MFLLLRRIRHVHLRNRQLGKYLLYAAGEIALQIDNWNSERQEEATLRSYLASISTAGWREH